MSYFSPQYKTNLSDYWQTKEKLINIPIFSIEYVVANNINYDTITDEFASFKARKMQR
jgi:hypothetical protein